MPKKPPQQALPVATEAHVSKEPTLTKAPPPGKLFPCANCGAKVEFDPRSRTLKCPYCGHETAIAEPGKAETAAAVVEHEFDAYIQKLKEGNLGALGTHSSQVKCTACGAVVLVEDKVVTDTCPFCSTHLENKPESVEGMIPPESVIPFELDLRAARHSFEKWVEGLWFAPSALKKLADLGQLTGIYIPYWTYDAMTYSRYSGLRGDDYLETESYTEKDAQGNDVTRTRTVTRTVWTPVSGEVQHFFDDVLVCGSKTLTGHLVYRLEPWKLSELEPFKSDFLAGMKTERYAVGLKDGLEAAKHRMEPTIASLIQQDIGGNHQQILSKKTQYLAVTFKHCLLPVWMANYRYQEKVFHILVNGRTGKVSGERPWSFWKIFGLVAIILAVIAFIVILFASFQKSSGGGNPRRGSIEQPDVKEMAAMPPLPRSRVGLTPIGLSWGEPDLRPRAICLACEENAVVKAAGPSLPELDRPGEHAVAAPVWRSRHVPVGIFGHERRVLRLQECPVRDDFALSRCPGTQTRTEGPGDVVGV
jgi:DNA-directed RNA polymerase subunit RPC12/RpoP